MFVEIISQPQDAQNKKKAIGVSSFNDDSGR